MLQVPPVVVQLSVVALPVQAKRVPVIAAGISFTVIVIVVFAPENAVNVMIAVPAEMAVTTPDVLPTVAIEMSLLVHDVPGADMQERTPVLLAQYTVGPVMGSSVSVSTDIDLVR